MRKKFPRYAEMVGDGGGTTTMRLERVEIELSTHKNGQAYYYRDNGEWGCVVGMDATGAMRSGGDTQHPSISRKEFRPITKAKWAEENERSTK